MIFEGTPPGAIPARRPSSNPLRFSTGSDPGRPRQTGHTSVLGGEPKRTGQPQKILVFVPSWTWTSSPIVVIMIPPRFGGSCPSAGDPSSPVTAVRAAGGSSRLGHPPNRRHSFHVPQLFVMIGGLLVGIGGLQDRRLVKGFADELE